MKRQLMIAIALASIGAACTPVAYQMTPPTIVVAVDETTNPSLRWREPVYEPTRLGDWGAYNGWLPAPHLGWGTWAPAAIAQPRVGEQTWTPPGADVAHPAW